MTTAAEILSSLRRRARRSLLMRLERPGAGGEIMMVPRFDRQGRVVVDPTWGEIQPLEVAPGVETVAELDVVEHLEEGLPLVDTRHEAQHRQATLPGANNIPHEQIADRVDELDREQVTILFCNGPQCKATPDAVRSLLAGGYPAGKLRYYRGGIHDWMTLGLPIEGSRAEPTPER